MVVKIILPTSYEIQEIAKKDHKNYDCLIVAILTHGAEGKLCGTDQKLISVKEITSCVENFCF